MTYKANSQFAVAQALTDISATAVVPIGTRVKGNDPTYGEGEFIYLKGVASTVAGSVVSYKPSDGVTALLVANAANPVAVAMAACVAGYYGWYQIFGVAVGKVLALFADNAACYGTATPGSVDDTVVAGDRVKCMRGNSAIDTPTTGFALLGLEYPFVDDIAD